MRHVVAFLALILLAFGALDHFDHGAPPLLITAAHAAEPVPADSPPLPTTSLPSPYMIDTATLAYVDCDKYMGTAVQVAPGRYITAAHVATAKNCKIGSKAIVIESIDVTADWAIITSGARLPFYVVTSCSRLVEGQSYFASGFAEGNPWPITTRLIAERYHDKAGTSFLKGSIISGMSGGSVVDGDGVLHAINDTRTGDGVPLAGVVELADTPLCRKIAKN